MKLSTVIFAALLFWVGSTQSRVIFGPFIFPAPTPFYMVSNSDTVVVGKVTSIEKELIEVSEHEGANKDHPKEKWRVANVRISETLLGAKGIRIIRVGFPLNLRDPRTDKIKGDSVVPSGRCYPTLSEDQEGIFILKPHWEGDFYILTASSIYTPTFFDTQSPDYNKSLAETRLLVEAIKEPTKALKSEEKEDRIKAAVFLARRYREKKRGRIHVDENLSAEESKLILQVLTEMPWADKGEHFYGNLERALNVWLAQEMQTLKYSLPKIPDNLSQDEANKLYKDNAVKFINDNIDKITLKKYVEKK